MVDAVGANQRVSVEGSPPVGGCSYQPLEKFGTVHGFPGNGGGSGNGVAEQVSGRGFARANESHHWSFIDTSFCDPIQDLFPCFAQAKQLFSIIVDNGDERSLWTIQTCGTAV